MHGNNECPLRPAKAIARQLRAATERLARNNLLSTIISIDPHDIEINVNHNTEPDDINDLADNSIMVDGDEAQMQTDSIMRDDTVVVDYPYLDDDNDIDDIQNEHAEDQCTVNDAQSSIPNFRTIEKYLIKKQENILQSKKVFVCPQCSYRGTSSSKCENESCNLKTGFHSTPTTLCTFRLLPQIISILERHTILPECNGKYHLGVSDVQESHIRRNIVLKERLLDPNKQIVTFLLNSDGVVIKKFSRSVWITSMVINELPRKIRFNNNNIIICSISMGSNKPKKYEFQSFISEWVHELKQLELGFYICPPNLNENFVKVHGFLIAAALDKPAQALLMNINDPTGYYSCVRCTIKGDLL
ncbi:hypothetical protein I4U23_022953 [Adineta vaga]|nr:hypothetical protein I4U23_022953 [Adineta vaga]